MQQSSTHKTLEVCSNPCFDPLITQAVIFQADFLAEQQMRARLDSEVSTLTVERDNLIVYKDQATETIKSLENAIQMQAQQASEKIKGLEDTNQAQIEQATEKIKDFERIIQVLNDEAWKHAEQKKIEDVCNLCCKADDPELSKDRFHDATSGVRKY